MINSIANTYSINFLKPKASSTQQVKSLSSDTFVRSTSFKGRDKWAELIDTMDPIKYSNLDEKEKNELRAVMKEFCYDEQATEAAKAAKVLKCSLDEEYGEDKWVYVSIGRSCSLLAKALEFMGTDAKSIPISGLSSGIQHGKELTEKEGFDKYRNFIYDLGLNPESVKNSGKTYVFQDFTSSGNSLKRFEEFLKTDEMGLDLENVVFESINDRLEKSYPKLKEYGVENFHPTMFVYRYLGLQVFGLKQKSSLQQLYPNELNRIDYLKNANSNCMNRLFEFGILDKMNELGTLKQ